MDESLSGSVDPRIRDLVFSKITNGRAIQILESIPPNNNPYHYDAYHCGMDLKKDLHGMNVVGPSDEKFDYIILIRKSTGQRVRINLEELFALTFPRR